MVLRIRGNIPLHQAGNKLRSLYVYPVRQKYAASAGAIRLLRKLYACALKMVRINEH
jgi:hypothetical protein